MSSLPSCVSCCMLAGLTRIVTACRSPIAHSPSPPSTSTGTRPDSLGGFSARPTRPLYCAAACSPWSFTQCGYGDGQPRASAHWRSDDDRRVEQMRVLSGAPVRAAFSLLHARLAAKASSGSRTIQTAVRASADSCSRYRIRSLSLSMCSQWGQWGGVAPSLRTRP
eukprot:scaffold41220_cov71-Phaeocystis_antarctica.AAC.16